MSAEPVSRFPVGEHADETVRWTIEGLIKGRGLRTEDVAKAVGINRGTMYRRLAGKGSSSAFTAGEIASLARYFGMSPDRIYSGLDGAFMPPKPPYRPVAVARRPRQDSNPRPTGYNSASPRERVMDQFLSVTDAARLIPRQRTARTIATVNLDAA